MKKLLSIVLVVMLLVLSAIPAYAANHGRFDTKENLIIYEREITVTEDGGVYQVGFATIKFPENFIDQSPITIKVKICAADGIAGIEFTPDIPVFNADVTVNVHSYNGLLYDETSGRNTEVRIRHQMLKLEHFSRYAFS